MPQRTPDKRMREIRKLILFSSFPAAIGGYSANASAPSSPARRRRRDNEAPIRPKCTLAELLMCAVFRRVPISSHVTVTAGGGSVSAG